MPLSDHVTHVITQDTVGLPRKGFGINMILSCKSAADSFNERIRFYADEDEVLADFASDSPEYLAAAGMFAQEPHPEQVAIGRALGQPTQRYELSVVNVLNSTAYGLNVKGEGVTTTAISSTSDSAATQAEIHSALLTALNAVVGKNFTATHPALVVADQVFTADSGTDQLTAAAHGYLTGDGPVRVSNSGGALPAGLVAATDYWAIRIDANTFKLASTLANAFAGTAVDLTDNGTGVQTVSDTASTVRPDTGVTVTGDAPADWFSLEILDPEHLRIAQTHAEPATTLATDLAAIENENGSWYALCTLYNSEAYVEAAAAKIESMDKIYIADSNETLNITAASDGTQGVFDDLKTLAYARTAGIYHPDPSAMAAARWLGYGAAFDPGSDNWAYNNLAGLAATSLTTTHKTNLKAKNANYYYTVATRNVTFPGTTANGTSDNGYIDVIRSLDWAKDDMNKAVLEVLVAGKVPYTKKGVARIQTAMEASLTRGTQRSVWSDDPKPKVTVPKLSAISSADKAGRILPDMKYSATLAGAINTVQINGVVSI